MTKLADTNLFVGDINDNIALNWVDGAAYLYKWSGPATFNRILDFITLYPNYNPGDIGDFVNENWLDIR